MTNDNIILMLGIYCAILNAVLLWVFLVEWQRKGGVK